MADATRRQLNRTFYRRFYLDDEPLEVTHTDFELPFDEIQTAANTYQRYKELTIGRRPRTGTTTKAIPSEAVVPAPRPGQQPVLADIFPVTGSSKRVVVVLWRQFSNSSPSPLKRAIRAYRRLSLTGPRPERPRRVAAPKRQIRLRTEQIVQLVEHYQAGASVYELGREFGISRKTVSTHLVRAGVARRYRLLDETAAAKAAQLYRDGCSLARIAEDFSVSPGTVHAALRRAGVAMRDSHGRPRT